MLFSCRLALLAPPLWPGSILGLHAYSLGIAYEFDPYFGLSISRVDPLPHQLEAVYDYLLKLPRVRFLRLANALSALYPTGSEEKRLLDAMLVAIPR